MNYFTNLFNGRISRKTYILGTLFLYFLYLGIPILVAIALMPMINQTSISYIISISILVMLPFFVLYNISLSVRRLHDLGKSYIFLLLTLIPYIGVFALNIYLIGSKSENASNKFGDIPQKNAKVLSELFNPVPSKPLLKETQSSNRYRINLSSHIFAKFGQLELGENQLAILTDSVSPILIPFEKIVEVNIERWMLFNFKITIKYNDSAEQKSIKFATGDIFSTNILRTVYLYKKLQDVIKNRRIDSSYQRGAIWDRIPIPLGIIAAYIVPYTVTKLYGYYGIEGIVFEFLVGAYLVPFVFTTLCTIRANKVIKGNQ